MRKLGRRTGPSKALCFRGVGFDFADSITLNLTNADFGGSHAEPTRTLREAIVAGAISENTTSTGFTKEQFVPRPVTGIGLGGIWLSVNGLAGWNSRRANLTGARLVFATLTKRESCARPT